MTEERIEDVFETMVNQHDDAMKNVWDYIDEQKKLWYENNPGAVLTNMKLEKRNGQYSVIFEGLKSRE